jgi:hypothetical protein
MRSARALGDDELGSVRAIADRLIPLYYTTASWDDGTGAHLVGDAGGDLATAAQGLRRLVGALEAGRAAASVHGYRLRPASDCCSSGADKRSTADEENS